MIDDARPVSAAAARECIENGRCPWCGAGPFQIIATHTKLCHGIDGATLRRFAGLPKWAVICGRELSARKSARLEGRAFAEAAQTLRRVRTDRSRPAFSIGTIPPLTSSVSTGPRGRLSAGEILKRHTVRAENGCLLWTGATAWHGYGKASITVSDGRRIDCYAHRLSYEYFVGHIPDGLILRHSCDTPACVEPTHLTPGTMQENVQDMIERARQPARWLAPDVVHEMYERFGRGESVSQVSREMGLSKGTVSARKTRWSRSAG